MLGVSQTAGTKNELVKFKLSSLRLGFLIALITDWANTLGLKEIRADPQHSFVSTANVDPTEESCGLLSEQLSMLVAQFGIKFPNGSKFKVGPPDVHYVFSGTSTHVYFQISF